VRELGLQGVAVLLAREVTGLTPRLGDPPGDPVHHLLDRELAVGRAELAAEVLLGDDVGRVLRPALRELDPALLEGGVLRVADHRVADLPVELVEGMDARGGEPAFDDQASLARPC
jgi:hypothetical protein